MNRTPRDLAAFQEFLDVHGADRGRWPVGADAAIGPWLDQEPEARAALARAARLEAMIESVVAAGPEFDGKAAAARAIQARQVAAFRPRPVFARPLAALAASLLLGFIVGASGLLPGGKSSATLDAMDLAKLASDAFGLEESL